MNFHSAGEVLEKSTVKVAWWPMRRLCFWWGVVRSPSFGLFSTPLNPTSYVIELEKGDKNIAKTWRISAHATFFTSDEPMTIRWISCVSFSGKNNLFSGRNQFKKETPYSILWLRFNNKTFGVDCELNLNLSLEKRGSGFRPDGQPQRTLSIVIKPDQPELPQTQRLYSTPNGGLNTTSETCTMTSTALDADIFGFDDMIGSAYRLLTWDEFRSTNGGLW